MGVVTAQQAPPAEDPIAAYRARLRPRSLRYAAVVVGVSIALLITVLIAWAHGENAAIHLHTVANPPAAVPAAPLAAAPTMLWQTTDHPAIGQPYWNGTAVTYSAHTVSGRNLATGVVTWSYTRTDRTVCQVVQVSGVSMALYELHGDCTELTALDTDTGQRRWERTLDKDTNLIIGHPTYSVGEFTVLITTPKTVYAIDPTGGLDRWTFNQPGCTIRGAVIGSTGALISQTCTDPQCSGLKFCGKGDQLLLRDANAGHEDDASKANGDPDQIKWNLIGNGEVPVSADQTITAAHPDGSGLTKFVAATGKASTDVPLTGGAVTAGAVFAVQCAADEVVWLGGRSYVLGPGTPSVVWSAATSGPPTVTSPDGATDPSVELRTATVLAPVQAGIAVLDPATGAVTRTVAVGATGTAYPVGNGFLVAGATLARYG
jgi:outer membrane protein assembly factor BamB